MSDLISRQDAIDALSDAEDAFGYLTKDWEEVLMGVTSAEPRVVGELISRQAAIDALAEDMPSAYTPDGSHPADEGIFMAQEIYADCIQTLKELPSAEPKRGRWISADAIFGGVPFYCSECGENTLDTVMGKPRWNFCPNCGAKMEAADGND